VLNAFAARSDVLATKLVSGKETFVHRRLWPAVLSIGMSQDGGSLGGLSAADRRLPTQVERCGEVVATGASVKKLQRRLLVHGESFHTKAGNHATRLQSWKRWAATARCRPMDDAGEARLLLEQIVVQLNQDYGGDGRLPWRIPGRKPAPASRRG
jgi:hypothetical protein